MSIISELVRDVLIPDMMKVYQRFDAKWDIPKKLILLSIVSRNASSQYAYCYRCWE